MNRAARNLAISGLVALAAAWALPHVVTTNGDFGPGLLAGIGAGLLLGAVLRSRLPASCDTATPARRRRYLREFVPPMALYVLTICLSVWLLKQVEHPLLRIVIALAPVPPVALAVRAMMRHIRDADELQRRIEVEALAIGTAWVSVGYLAAGLLQQARMIDIPSSAAMIWVFPLVSVAYAVAKVAVTRRYA
jgi:hypothetical protein